MTDYPNYQLAPGTLLDERYVIRGVLGEGGFGITYEAVNERVNVRVAIKEFYYREFVTRDCRTSSEILFTGRDQEEVYEKAKERFLREARIIGDFIDEPGIVGVTDYFEANGTAYIVMNFLDGTTLKDYLKEHGIFEAEKIFRMILPLAETLAKIHDCGIIHRDISPDNIMVMADGSLKLLDFGAARDYLADTEKTRSVILKNGYAPCEQYDRNGSQGPWTDIYALCAVLYECITGRMPDGALQRMFLDELKLPSDLGIAVSPALEAVLKKGLAVDFRQRYPSVSDLIKDIRKELPEELPDPGGKVSRKKAAFLCAGAVILCAAAGGILYYINQNAEKFKFRGVRTETVLLTPNEDMSAREYYDAIEVIEKRVELLAGKNNYLIKENDGELTLTMPLDVFCGKNTDYILRRYLSRPLKYTVCSDSNMSSFDLSDNDVVSAQLKTGMIPGTDPSMYEDTETDSCRYIELELNDVCSDRISELLDQSTGALYLVPDAAMANTGYIRAYPGEDFHTVYVTCDQEGTLPELRLSTFSDSEFSTAFTFRYEIAADWEDAQSSIMGGENQYNEDEISLPAVNMLYTHSEYGSAENRGVWYHTLSDFKTRLDALGIPYAFGVSNSDPYNIVIRIEQKYYSDMLGDLLFTRNTLSITDNWTSIYCSDLGSYELLPEGDGTYIFQIDYSGNEYKTEELLSLTETIAQSDSPWLYLTQGGYLLAKCRIDEPISDGCVRFDTSCLTDPAITDQNLPLFRLLIAGTTETEMPVQYTLYYLQCLSEDSSLNYELEEENEAIMPDPSETDRIEAVIHDVLPEASCTEDYSYTHTMRITLPYDETFSPEDLVELLARVFEEGELDYSSFQSVSFYYPDPDEPGQFLGRISFSKLPGEKEWDVYFSFYSEVLNDYLQTVQLTMKEHSYFGQFHYD